MTVIPFRTPRTGGPEAPKTPPMLNVPPLTLAAIAIIALVHVTLALLPQDLHANWGYNLAFVAKRYTDPAAFDVWALLSPFTHVFLHGGWLHIAMNTLMLMAFGAGCERMLGGKRAGLLFVLSGLGGALAQFALNPFSPIPMIGASGAISGLFAALILRLQQTGMMPKGRYGIWGMAALWIGLSFIVALAGGAVGVGDVAWAAHAGGFIAGVGLMRLRYFSA